jgi:hypothetical protein
MFRLVFKKAREDPRSNFHVYVSAALMEYYCSKVFSSVCFQQQCRGSASVLDSELPVYIPDQDLTSEKFRIRVMFSKVVQIKHFVQDVLSSAVAQNVV